MSHESYNQSTPVYQNGISEDLVKNLKMVNDIFKKIEEETAQTAEMIFDYLVNVPDEQIMTGKIPPHEDETLNTYIKIMNRLFLFSRKDPSKGGFRILTRRTIEALDKKTFAICMCHDGGVSVDILCDIVNTENQARTPTRSPVKVTVTQVFGNNEQQISR